MKHYDLLAVDVDGTLSTPGDGVADEVIESLRTCQRSGVLVTFATGKRFIDVKSLCERIGIDGPVIACNGAMIVEASTNDILSSHFLSKSSLEAIIAELESDERASVAVFTPMDIISTSGNSLASSLLSSIGEQTTRRVTSLLESLSDNVVKVLVAANSERLASVYDSYSMRFSSQFSVTTTGDAFVEFMAPKVSKGNALQWIAERLSIATEAIACVGDSNNDLSMFQVAGYSIAVANATSLVLEAADTVVASASEGGVMQAVDLILGSDKAGIP